ncbi:NAD(P)/FAD-dependent oxidoreductase [Azospirillum sp. 412522]|nr:NAD(P)/FAD-dependent oxidoreductase [Azospirillum sp. 412522]
MTAAAAIEADAVVVGAGPAGTAFALNLAPLRRVLVLDRRDTPAIRIGGSRIGESLAPAARRLLTDMGLWEAFLAEGHSPCHGGRSVWGGPLPVEADNLRDLDGPGWHLDRGRFDGWLRRMAASRGAALLVPAQPLAVTRDGTKDGEGWLLEVENAGRRFPVRTRLLVDAGGRGSPLAKRFGARRTVSDRLVCGWVHGRDAPGRQSGLTWIEAEPDGWWYSAPLPAGRRVVAFHTDADLPAAADARDAGPLLRRLSCCSVLSQSLSACGFEPDGQGGFCAAHSSALSPAAGDGWLAVGDAALGFDPLSSQGIFNALYTGLAAAEAADRHLSGDPGALPGYAAGLAPIRDAYRTHLRAWYGLERRWRDRPFWSRRVKE